MENVAAQPMPRIADRLAAARRGRFVGRMAEIDLFRAALLADEPPFAVLYIYGPGGVGKTTLLHEYARIAAECGRPVLRLDARNVDPNPPGMLFALRRSLGRGEEAASETIAALPDTAVLLIDTYEIMAGIDAWLRETFLPQLPARSLVVIAGRNPPTSGWRTDIDWADLTRIVPLRNLRPEESQTYLATRGIPDDRHVDVLRLTHGHPLALALMADVLGKGATLPTTSLHSEPDLVRVLLERLVQDIPSAEHRVALEVCTLSWVTTEALLASVLGAEHAREYFEWLRQISFIEHGAYGLFPHDLARDALDADFRWRNPDGHRQLTLQLASLLHKRFEQARGVEQQRIWFDLIFLARQNPFFRPYFEWSTLGSAYAEPASEADYPAILAMVEQHQGAVAAEIARHWLRRQPDAFLAYRDATGEVFGFMAHLMIHDATPEDLAIDPAVSVALQFVERHGPIQPGEEILHLRFWMGRETYQDVSATVNLTAINCSIHWTTHPRLAWNFLAVADPDFIAPHFSSIHMWRSPEADFEVDGQRFGVFAHDWRVEPPAAWLNIKAELADATIPVGAPPTPRPAATVTATVPLSRSEHAEAVRQALRDYTRPDRLAMNPLMCSRIVGDASPAGASPAGLQAVLREAIATLSGNPRDVKFHRAIWHTYIEPAPTQEQAAELLDLPFNTYRYHLSKGIERIVECLWQREQTSSSPTTVSRLRR